MDAKLEIPCESRSVNMIAYVKAPAVNGFGFTAPMADHTWLRKIRLWFVPKWTGAGDWIDFWLRYGSGRPVSVDKLNEWEELLPVQSIEATASGFRELATGMAFEWTMLRYFHYPGLRFGIKLVTAGLINYLECYVSFEISEG